MQTIRSWNIIGRCEFIVKIKRSQGYRNIIEREIDLAYGLKDKMESILINHSKYFMLQITF